ncbi:MAG: GNAT family N-acetyltransferase [archaeon]|nr:GNAT family N-acetyltransferase [archaeon]
MYGIYILREWQKKGIGRELVRETARRLIKDGFDSMLVWVLADNPSRAFYELLGGKQIRNKSIAIGGAELEEVAYGWLQVDEILR